MYTPDTFGSPSVNPVLIPLTEEMNLLSKKDAHKVASFINDRLSLIKEFDASTVDQKFREYCRKHIRTDIIADCERFPQSIKSFVRNFLLTRLRMVITNRPKCKCNMETNDRVGTVLFTAKPTHPKVIKTDMVMLMDPETGLYNQVWKNRYGKQGFIHTKRILPGKK